jgi:hypothetical protein
MEPQEKSNGALIGSIIIIIILIIGGIYFWKTSLEERVITPEETTSQNYETSADLEANVNSIDLESLDQDL